MGRCAVVVLRRGSHRAIAVSCEFRASPKCRGSWKIEERLARETRSNNGGKILCVFCSRALKGSGRKNKNVKYPALDDAFFSRVDTEAKAYLLGWIASDGSITKGSIRLYLHEKDAKTLSRVRDLICAELPLRQKKPHLVGFTINSTQVVADICRWLDIPEGKKSSTVGFPQLETEALGWAFLRGLFDGDGSVSSVEAANRRSARAEWPAPRCTLTSNSSRLLDAVARFCRVPSYRGTTVIEWAGSNALDFLGKLYGNTSLYLTRKRDLYLDWCCW